MSDMSLSEAINGPSRCVSSGAYRIQDAFSEGKALVAFLTGGDPTLELSYEYICALIKGGVDLIEIGIPFSDPIAEGPIIQEASLRALKAGTTIDALFDLVRKLRRGCGTNEAPLSTPLLFMGYLNPIFHYGYERFFFACAEAGVDGIVIADLPFDEQEEVREYASAHGIALISLIAPTSAARIQTIAREAEGFIYLVSSLGVTGQRLEITTDLSSIISLIREVTDVPVAVGFGIHTPEQAYNISRLADGVIVGSAIVQRIAESPEGAAEALFDYARHMKQAMIPLSL